MVIVLFFSVYKIIFFIIYISATAKEIYEALKTVKFIDLNKTKKNTKRLDARNKSRKPTRKALDMVRNKISSEKGTRYSGVFGKTMNPTSKWRPVPSALSKKYPKINRMLFAYVKARAPPGFKFDCITINHNVKCKKHTDSRNSPVSLITSVGNYTGGELCIQDPKTKKIQAFDTKNRFLLYDGKSWPHWNKPIKGDKFSIVAYYRYGKGRNNIPPTTPKWIR